MATYKGPHVAVHQNFEQSAPATAVEDLPSAIVGTAFEVYENEKIGSHSGIEDKVLAWSNITDGATVFNDSVISKEAYDFYPVKTTTSTSFGVLDVDADVNEDGVKLDKDASFAIPETTKVSGSSVAKIPYYTQSTSCVVASNNTNIINIANGSVASAGIVRGQRVYISDKDGWKYAGVVDSTPNTEGQVRVTKSVPAGSYSEILIGCEYGSTAIGYPKQTAKILVSANVATVDQSTAGVEIGQSAYLLRGKDWFNAGPVSAKTKTTITIDAFDKIKEETFDGIEVKSEGISKNKYPNTFYDASADFISTKVKVGDLVKFTGVAIGGQEQVASVTNVLDKNTLFFSTKGPAGAGSDYLHYKSARIDTKGTVRVTSYSVNRLLGFSTDNNYDASGAPSPVGTFTGVATPTSSILVSLSNDKAPKVGDLVAFALSAGVKPTVTTNVITGVIKDKSGYNITLETSITLTDAGYELYTWTPKTSHDINVTFRAISDKEIKRATRIGSIDDIRSNFGDITPYNELAFMLNATYGLSGGRVCYGVNVDPSDDISTQYAEALNDVLGTIDVYSHALGTTEGGVNALLGAYVDSESDPYQGHERIAIAVYNEEDLLLIGAGTINSLTEGDLSISGLDLIESEVRKGDKVVLTNKDVEAEYIVTSSPVTSAIVEVKYVSGTKDITSGSATFYTGGIDAQAEKISALKYGNRRVAVVFPGWFQAEYNGETKMFPPYFISAALAGLDGGQIASQSLTNLSYSIPGLSNYKLDTNRFKKSQLDVIGAAGIDIMVQDAVITQFIRSRHDLTSNMDSIEFRERSITKQVDVVAKTHRAAIAPYVGRYNISDALIQTVRQIVSVTNTVLKKDTIKDIAILSIGRDPKIKDKILIVLKVTVFVAGNNYDFILNVNS